MKINNLLIVPSSHLIKQPIRILKSKLYGTQLPHHAEIQYAGDITAVLGTHHTFVLGHYYPHLHSTNLPDMCSYPSCHGAPQPTFVSPRHLKHYISKVDAILVSSTSHPQLARRAINSARRLDLPIAILDILDYDTLYGAPDVTQRLTLNFKPGRDFDIYFKKDLPLGFRTNTIFPFGPIPVRPESYNFKHLAKQYPVFYSGRKRENQSSPERAQLVDLVAREIPDANIVTHDTRGTFMTRRQYWDYLSQSRLALSPSGRCWDSFRHCEVGLAPNVALMLPRPFITTCGPPMQDGINCILYDITLKNGRYYLADPAATINKLKSYLSRPDDLLGIARQWQQDVMSGHTILARSQYLINTMEKYL